MLFQSLTHARAVRDGIIDDLVCSLSRLGDGETDEDEKARMLDHFDRICQAGPGWLEKLHALGIYDSHLIEAIEYIARKESQTVRTLNPITWSAELPQ